MLGTLPTSLEVCGKSYKIRPDYRNILRIFEGYADDTLSEQEKLLLCLRRIYVDFNTIPRGQYEQAYKAAYTFISCNAQEDKKPPIRTFSWIKDEQLIFPAVNKVAGMEVRAVPFLHWWTFMGYFESIDAEGLFGTVLSIRQKKARGKKLEKHEREFCRNNPALMALDYSGAKPAVSPEQTLKDMFDNLPTEAGD